MYEMFGTKCTSAKIGEKFSQNWLWKGTNKAGLMWKTAPNFEYLETCFKLRDHIVHLIKLEKKNWILSFMNSVMLSVPFDTQMALNTNAA